MNNVIPYIAFTATIIVGFVITILVCFGVQTIINKWKSKRQQDREITKRFAPLLEGRMSKGGQNPPRKGTGRPPPPKGSENV